MSGKGILLFPSEFKEEFLNIGIVNKVTPYFRGGLFTMLIIILYHSKTVVFEWYICYTYVKNIQVLYYYGQNKNFVYFIIKSILFNISICPSYVDTK